MNSFQPPEDKLFNKTIPTDSPYKVLVVEDEFVVANDLKLALTEVGYSVLGIANSVARAEDLMKQQKPDIVLLDIYLKGEKTGIDLAKQLEEDNIPFIYISANDNRGVLEEVKATKPSGYIVKPFRDQDLLTTVEIARYKHEHSCEKKLREEKALQIALSDALSTNEDWGARLLKVTKLIQQYIPFDLFVIQYKKQKSIQNYIFYRTGFDEYQTIDLNDLAKLTNISLEKLQEVQSEDFETRPKNFDLNDVESLRKKNKFVQILAKAYRLESLLFFPMKMLSKDRLHLSFYSRKPDTYLFSHQDLLVRLEQPMMLTLDRVLAHEQIAKLSEQLQLEKTYLQEEVKTTANFEEIIGTSQLLLEVFDQVSQVAPTEANVLILGESGTGKELFARAIHNLSSRKDKILVKINCAALPASLIESELFGHEKGAFTGAIDKRVGKFELANEGTIFLDEIGEMPLELQAKLLRVLQEKEIERVGGNQPIKTDVRVIAATNRNLEKEVNEDRFRMDLYFRLSTFPIALPPLRERKVDIPQLAAFFAQRAARKIGRPFLGISQNSLQQLVEYSWPGNIRELENVIEQAVILNRDEKPIELGRSLNNNLFSVDSYTAPTGNKISAQKKEVDCQPKNLKEVKQIQQETERDYILSILRQTNGRIRGSGGAAELLNLKPSTLEYRIEKLGIRKVITS